ncbi:molybdopterin-guanine dinucleotide biosynthesis protein B [Metabacillus litoralis]|uniref:molybdopterin-guanine dinucleotide biosynthesis protein B n=1 Tax=Metabacillus TaxID=2675233 RepID=UPI000EF5A603|nr:molybdopterin-guanine dinucleotide biosynthesis protein B [Metabacillus litoralis]MCM3160268.1 molybdopterin-guanine dinucleotide biosynthesis protein B [Metabacillus litoralis]MCM3408852.1 molybdopterin-guanine dinucleotide biosynthesis protein B [Metabacillus litoralis]UHA59497.1 molybdopterin-guanine dinucleotide biosynthesis protein B [Metabacillus litoralis]
MGRILQVVGFQNSGKTTFVTGYIKACAEAHLKVGTIKHHGHGGTSLHHDQQKDTGKHRQAGAYVTLVEGNGSFILSSDKLTLTLKQMITLYNVFELDLILVEGFKFERYPKVVLLRGEEDIELLDKLENVCCILASFSLPKIYSEKFRVYSNMKECINWLINTKAGEYIDNSNV